MADILNLTQHTPTPDQAAEGVREPADKDRVRALLTFQGIPSREEIDQRAHELAEIALNEAPDAAMIAGAPYLMGPLESALRSVGIRPLYAFSERVSVEETDPETGEVVKTNIFRHLGFVG